MKPGVTPTRARVRRIHPAIYDAFKTELNTMVSAGILIPAPAHVPWASAIVVVPKRATAVGKHAGVRICGDFTSRNTAAVVPDYEHPLVGDLLNNLSSFAYASTLDLTMGYSQVIIPPELRESTTIVTPEGRFMYKRLPQGLAESAAIFSSGVADILQHLINVGTVLQYVDDIAIVTREGKAGDPKTIRRHIADIDKTLSALSDANIRVNLLKSSFLSTSISYLGCIVSDGKRSIDPSRLQGLNNLEAPRNLREAEAFGGLANYHSTFVKDLATTLAPLNDYIANERRERKINKKHSASPPSSVIAAFVKSKDAILQATALLQPRPDRPFVIQSDASDIGMGTCLLQANDAGILCPVAYASQKWTPTQTRYSVTDREMMGVALAFRKWPQLLQYAPDILVQSDHQNLAAWTESASPRVSRLALFLSRFRIRFAWLKGTDNTLADVLSRLRPDPNAATGTVSTLIVNTANDTNSSSSNLFGPQFDNCVIISDDHSVATLTAARDLSIGLAICVSDDSPPCYITGLQSDELSPSDSIPPSAALDTALLRRISRAQLDSTTEKKRLLDAGFISPSSRLNIDTYTFTSNNAVWIPSSATDIITELMSLSHDNCGHSGVVATLHRLRDANVQWVNMDNIVRSYVTSCHTCTTSRSKPSKFKHGRLGSYLDIASAPGHLLVADYAGPFPVGDGVDDDGKPIKARYTLTFVDWYSRHAKIYATEKADAATTIDCLHRYCENFGRPLRFKSDRGSHFVNEPVKTYLSNNNIVADFSLAYRPEAQGVVERLHSPLVRAMRAYTGLDNAAWARQVSRIQWALNTSFNSSIGTSPYTVFFGRKPNTELTNSLGAPLASFDTYEARLVEADTWTSYVRECLELAHERNTSKHEDDHVAQSLKPDDTVAIWQPPGNNHNKLSRSIRIGTIVKSDEVDDQVYHVRNAFCTPNSNNLLHNTSKYHVDRLRRIPAQRSPPTHELESEHINMLSRGLGNVDSISSHRRHPSATYSEFHVTWAHVPAGTSNPQWVPGHSITMSAKYTEYVTSHPDSARLPPLPPSKRAAPRPRIIRPHIATTIVQPIASSPITGGGGPSARPNPVAPSPSATTTTKRASSKTASSVSTAAASSKPAATAPTSAALAPVRGRQPASSSTSATTFIGPRRSARLSTSIA